MTKRKMCESTKESSDDKNNTKRGKCSNNQIPEEKKSASDDSEQAVIRWSKSKKKRQRRKKAKLLKKSATGGVEEEEEVVQKDTSAHTIISQSPEKKNASEDNKERLKSISSSSSSDLQKSFKDRLSGSRFRILNEELYTSPSACAFRRFSTNPELYEQYHQGFRYQVNRWPVNPVNVIVNRLIKAYVANKRKPSSRQLVVADFGCGDAELAKQLLSVKSNGNFPFQVHSFDLVSSCDLVTACDMAHLPLLEASVDVGIFCLSLMGTNLADFIREAHRVLRPDGVLMIAEVRSRFETRNGQDDLKEFIQVMTKLGFDCSNEDRTNKMFLLLELHKNGSKPDEKVSFTAKPCIYKRR